MTPVPFFSDALWSLIEPLLPVESGKPKGGRPRIDNRGARTDLLFVQRIGLQWKMLPQPVVYGFGVTY